MSDQQQPGGIRRVTRKDRKRRLDPRGPLFPPEDDFPPLAGAAGHDDEDAPPDFPDVAAVQVAAPAPPQERFPPLEAVPSPTDAPPRPLRAAAPVRRRSACLPNLIAAVFLLATAGALVVFAVIAANPHTALNPFPPFTPVPIIITTTPLPPTPGPTASFTPLPVEAAATRSPFPFALAASLTAPNGNGQGCAWSSIAGSVTDADGAPLDGYLVRVTGLDFDQTVATGAALTFGPGGFEAPLAEAARAAQYTVQLLDPDGVPVSAVYPVETLAECEQNVTVISFARQQP